MRFRLPIGLALLLLLVLVAISTTFGWGDNAERLITNKAVDTLPDEMQPFFAANRQFIVQHVTDPDEAESKNPADQHNEFIQLDHYGHFPFTALPRSYTAAVSKYTRRSLETYGLLPWQIGLYSKHLTDAFRERNWNDVKLSAAGLSHYVASAHDPFNTTMNGDGKLSGQPGVNNRFGTGLVDRYQLFFFVHPNEAAFIHDPDRPRFRDGAQRALLARKRSACRRPRAPGPLRLHGRILRSLLRASRCGARPPAFGCLHGRRLVLDDCMDQCRTARSAVPINSRDDPNYSPTDHR